MLQSLIHLLFPKTCVCCENLLNEQEPHICGSCLLEIPVLEIDDDSAIKKLAGRVKIESALAYLKFNKSGKAQKILHEIKYKDNHELGIYIGKQYANYLKTQNIELDFDILVPVPLHSKRMKSRGYNQSEAIAKGLSDKLGIDLNTISLLKTKEAQSQTKKGRVARLENMQDCFVVSELVDLKGKHIAIVDDVMTTGATLEACCLSLEKAGVGKITVLSLAVA